MSAETKTAYFDHLPAKFEQTQWTKIIGPACQGDMEKLDLLCRAYWHPLFWFARRRGADELDAQDLVQGFFAKAVGKRKLEQADRQRGKFRTFLLCAFSRFCIDEWRKISNHPKSESLEQLLENHGDGILPTTDHCGLVKIYQDWAITLLNLALQRLEEGEHASGRGERFDLLKGRLHDGQGLAELSKKRSIPEGTLKADLHHLRKRMKELFVEEVKRTLNEPTKTELAREIEFVLHYAKGGNP